MKYGSGPVWGTLILLVFLGILLGLTSCSSVRDKIITEQELIVIDPSDVVLYCPDIPNMDLPEGFTQKDVSELLAEMYNTARSCKDALDAVRRYIEASKEIVGN